MNTISPSIKKHLNKFVVMDSRYKGKRPPARDGSAHIIIDDKLIIIGGDRFLFFRKLFFNI